MSIFRDEYNKIIREHFDISDDATRKCIVALEDGEETQLLSALSSALYDKIVEKVDQIDFGTIPISRGDITKVDGFENTVDCLNIIRSIVMEYKQDPAIVDIVLTAIENIKMRKGTFVKAYSLNVEFPMVLYNLITLAIENSVSFLIAVCIQYIKDPDTQTTEAALDKVAYNNTKDNLLFNQLNNFNKACATGDIDVALKEVMKNGGKISESLYNNEDPTDAGTIEYGNPICPKCGSNPCVCKVNSPFQTFDNEEDNCPDCKDHTELPSSDSIASNEEPVSEFGIGTAIGITGAIAGAGFLGLKAAKALVSIIIPALRSIAYFFVNSVVKFSDCLAVQSQFIEANAYKLQFSDNSKLDDKKKAKVVQKQLKVAKALKSIANKFAINDKTATKKAKDLQKQEEKQLKIEDIKDELPSDIYAKSVLF